MTTVEKKWMRPRTSHMNTMFVKAAFDQHGKRRVSFPILFPSHVGWSTAPYKKNTKPGKALPDKNNAKPLYVEGAKAPGIGNGCTSVDIFTFEKVANNMDKGPRVDNPSTVRTGDVLTFWMNSWLYNGEKQIFPEGVEWIPAYTVLELHINTTHNMTDGYGCKIAKIATHASSLYSYMTPFWLGGFPSSLDAAEANVALIQAKSDAIKQCRETKPTFYATPGSHCFTTEIPDLEFVRIVGEGGDPVLPGVDGIDIAKADLHKFTNSAGDMTYAMRLVDFAIAAGALRVVVTKDEYPAKKDPRLSVFRGVPLVDAETLLDPVDENTLGASLSDREEVDVTFKAGWAVPGVDQCGLVVGVTPVEKTSGVPPACSDLSLVSPACNFSQGYEVAVTDLADREALLVTVFNASPAHPRMTLGNAHRQAYKRARDDYEDSQA